MTNLYKEAFLRGFIKAANAGTTLPIGAPNPTLPANGNPMQPQVQPQIPASMQQFMQLMHEYRDPEPTAPKTIKPWYRQQ